MNNQNLKMFHHAVIITSNDKITIEKVHEKAKELFPHLTSEIVFSHYNHIVSFFIAPDGGKENKKISNEHDRLRNEFIHFVEHFSNNLSQNIELHTSTVGYYNHTKEIM